DGTARVVPPPPDREPGRAQVADGHADNSRAAIRNGVPRRPQGDRRAGRDDLEFLVGGGHLSGDDDGLAGPLVGREPELAQRARRAGKRDERLAGYVGERDLPPPGEAVPGADGRVAGLGGEPPPGAVAP